MDFSQGVLVLIDDIDRLTGDETREMFRLVKSLADFPNTIYLLAFDRARVASVLDESYGGAGSVYLEKIVQVSFELPLPPRESLWGLLTERIDAIIRDTPEDRF